MRILIFALLLAFPRGELLHLPSVAVSPKVHLLPWYTAGFE